MGKALRVMRVLLAVMTAALCLVLCWQAVDLYRIGNRPENFSAPGVRIAPVYSREAVAERLTALTPAFLVYGATAAVGLILQALAGKEDGRAPMEPEAALFRLRQRVTALPGAALSEQAARFRIWVIAAAVTAVCAAQALSYLLNRENFTDWDLETVMGGMLLHVLPWVALAFGALMTASHFAGKSVQREIALLKNAPSGKPTEKPEATAHRRTALLRGLLYAAAAALIALGVMNGGLKDVLVKAINICTECIGLG